MTHRTVTGAGIVAVVLTATLATGITYASTNHHGVKACARSNGDLILLSHGKCAHGSHRVTVGAKGAKGASGPRGLPAAKYWAQVDDSGSVVQSTGGVTVSQQNPAPGSSYDVVTFPANISRCVPIATLGENAGGSATVGEIEASEQSSTSVDVRVFSASNPSVQPTAAFSLALLC
jgi:hypothetical protein